MIYLLIIVLLIIPVFLLKKRNRRKFFEQQNLLEKSFYDKVVPSISDKSIGTLCEEVVFISEQVEVRTTGEDKFYKELLRDNRWSDKSEKIRRRDHEVCQNCYNTQKLENLDDLYGIVDFDEVADEVIDIFRHLSDYINDMDVVKDIVDGGVTHYIPLYNLYYREVKLLTNIIPVYTDDKNRSSVVGLRISDYKIPTKYLIISTFDDMNNVSIKTFSYQICVTKDSFRYKRQNDEIGFSNKVQLQYLKGNNTNGKYFLTYCFGLSLFCEYWGQAMLSCDEYAVIFPLYKLKSTEQLEVHHKKYSSTHIPWDVCDEDLITLCHSCHMEANKLPIPVEKV